MQGGRFEDQLPEARHDWCTHTAEEKQAPKTDGTSDPGEKQEAEHSVPLHVSGQLAAGTRALCIANTFCRSFSCCPEPAQRYPPCLTTQAAARSANHCYSLDVSVASDSRVASTADVDAASYVMLHFM